MPTIDQLKNDEAIEEIVAFRRKAIEFLGSDLNPSVSKANAFLNEFKQRPEKPITRIPFSEEEDALILACDRASDKELASRFNRVPFVINQRRKRLLLKREAANGQ